MTHRKDGPDWNLWHKSKEFLPDRNAWLRKIDWQIAEKIMGYQWFPISRKTDFCGYPFYNMLTTEPPDERIILEPDTHVPNYSTRIEDALLVAESIGLTSIPIMFPAHLMARWICDQALQSLSTANEA